MKHFSKLCVTLLLSIGLFFALQFITVRRAQAQEAEENFSWGTVNIVARQSAMQALPYDDSESELLRNNVRVLYKEHSPYDVIIGVLENEATQSAVTRRVLERVRAFVRDITNKQVQEKLKEHVVTDSLVLIRRQITKAREYAGRIREVRIGRVRMGNGQERHARVRIMGRGKDFISHTVLRMYLEKEESAWKISTIEGNFETLLEPYVSSGAFVPTGTLGVTQGL